MTYNVFVGTLYGTRSINQCHTEYVKTTPFELCDAPLVNLQEMQYK